MIVHAFVESFLARMAEGRLLAQLPSRLTSDHKEVLKWVDVFFGGFCGLMFLLALGQWLAGGGSWHSIAAIGVFLAANVAISQVSVRSTKSRSARPSPTALRSRGRWSAP